MPRLAVGNNGNNRWARSLVRTPPSPLVRAVMARTSVLVPRSHTRTASLECRVAIRVPSGDQASAVTVLG